MIANNNNPTLCVNKVYNIISYSAIARKKAT